MCNCWRLSGWRDNGNPNTELIPYKSVEQGSASYIVAAFDRTIDGKGTTLKKKTILGANKKLDQSGACIADSAIDPTTAPHALDLESAKKLWALSEKLVGQEFSYNWEVCVPEEVREPWPTAWIHW